MPRPATVKSPIRDLRAIIGKTQREFAFSIGISPIALTRIENGTLKLSKSVVRKIVYETNVHPRCLNGKLRTLRNSIGERYTKEFYKLWKEKYSWQDEDAAKFYAGRLKSAIETLLQASVFGYRKKMWLVYGEIAEALNRCRVDFYLQRPTNEILAKQRSPFLNRPLKWEDLLEPSAQREASFTAPRKPQSSSQHRRKA
jgi:transcriptional regulator with XRE-family HTH domain